ncbi:nucleotidyltransferase domain-containing protein [Gordonia sp. TBRC 11910]|uniref:Nucleotidyltransferase domain-containing protein n=1 Tax=Gordonia asplenii TaxID=2725283 RepID=A0A848L1R7_9ACTN|nr:nucleotidyltransferase domain-containing protein [Gordonia asplenii]NMO02461.1 nucleotidyltransferase domain-containing protein [Gordonia asplenii]
MNESDAEFVDEVADVLYELPGVCAVALGGSRASGTARDDSDWDFGLYYRGEFDPDDLRAVGWPGEIFDVGAWGGGIFNGGAWLRIDGRKVDIVYRDLVVVDHELGEAAAGRFHWEPLMFHLAGIPSYLVLAELSVNRVLRGEPLPKPDFAAPLRERASQLWRGNADLTLGYLENYYAPRGQVGEAAATLVTAAMQTAHAVLAERGEWAVNEKRLIDRAGLRGIDDIVRGMSDDPAVLLAAAAAARSLFARR